MRRVPVYVWVVAAFLVAAGGIAGGVAWSQHAARQRAEEAKMVAELEARGRELDRIRLAGKAEEDRLRAESAIKQATSAYVRQALNARAVLGKDEQDNATRAMSEYIKLPDDTRVRISKLYHRWLLEKSFSPSADDAEFIASHKRFFVGMP